MLNKLQNKVRIFLFVLKFNIQFLSDRKKSVTFFYFQRVKIFHYKCALL